MKTIYTLLFALIFITSCEMTEKVHLNEDGSLKYAVELDMAAISQMMAMDPESREQDFPLDTVMTIKDFAKRDFMGSKKKKNQNKEREENFEKVFKDFKVHVKMDENDGFFSFFTQKKSIADFNKSMLEMKKNIREIRQQNEDSEAEENMMAEFLGNVQLNFDGKNFKRSGEVNLHRVNNEEAEKMDELAGMLSYQLEYHFPRPVKSISDTTVLMSWDRKTIYLKKPMTLLMNNPAAYNFSVELED